MGDQDRCSAIGARSFEGLGASAAVGFEAAVPLLLGAVGLAGLGLLVRGSSRLGAALSAAAGIGLTVRRRVVSAAARAQGAVTGGPGQAPTRDTGNGAISLRLCSANLWNGASDMEPIAAEIRRWDPDVLLFQEITPDHLEQLSESGAMGGLETSHVRPDRGHAGLAIWSRLPLEEPEWFEVQGELQFRARAVLPDGRRLAIYGVHAPAPVPGKVERWRAWFSEMAREWTQDTLGCRGVGLLAGDYNATIDHRAFRSLLRAGLRDAARGRAGWRGTWSARWWPIPPLFRIDHVLTGPGMRVGNYRVGRSGRSDHRALIVDLLL